jgi:hypothetical protein
MPVIVTTIITVLISIIMPTIIIVPRGIIEVPLEGVQLAQGLELEPQEYGWELDCNEKREEKTPPFGGVFDFMRHIHLRDQNKDSVYISCLPTFYIYHNIWFYNHGESLL